MPEGTEEKGWNKIDFRVNFTEIRSCSIAVESFNAISMRGSFEKYCAPRFEGQRDVNSVNYSEF